MLINRGNISIQGKDSHINRAGMLVDVRVCSWISRYVRGCSGYARGCSDMFGVCSGYTRGCSWMFGYVRGIVDETELKHFSVS